MRRGKIGVDFLLLLISVVLIISSCQISSQGEEPVNEEPPGEEPVNVDILPVIDFNQPNLKAVEYVPGTENEIKANYYMFAPMITGWVKNSINAKIGNILRYSFMGNNVNIEISYDKSNKEIIFSGNIENNGGTLVVRFKPDSKTFDYENRILLCSIDPDTNEKEYRLLYSKFENVSLSENNFVHTNITQGFFCTNTELIMFRDSDLEFYIGYKNNSQDIITGWITKTKTFRYWDLTPLGLTNDNSLLDNFSRIVEYINTTQYTNFALDEEDGGDGYYMLCYYDKNSSDPWTFILYGENPSVTNETLDDFKTQVPWSLLE